MTLDIAALRALAEKAHPADAHMACADCCPMARSRTVMAAALPEALDEIERLRAGNCLAVIPDTFIACGEGGNYCSEACRLRAALVEACDIGDRVVSDAQNLPSTDSERLSALRAVAGGK